MARYTARQIQVEAVQFTDRLNPPEDVIRYSKSGGGEYFVADTVPGRKIIKPGDWLVTFQSGWVEIQTAERFARGFFDLLPEPAGSNSDA